MLRLRLAAPRASLISAQFFFCVLRASLSPSEYRPLGLYPSFLAHPVSFPFRVSLQQPSRFLSSFPGKLPVESSNFRSGSAPRRKEIWGQNQQQKRERYSSLFQNVGKNANQKSKILGYLFPSILSDFATVHRFLPQTQTQLSDSKGNSRVRVFPRVYQADHSTQGRTRELPDIVDDTKHPPLVSLETSGNAKTQRQPFTQHKQRVRPLPFLSIRYYY